jgi:hypothetical protein
MTELKEVIEGTRRVIFEKTQVYYYQCRGQLCTELCKVHNKSIMIGSYSCRNDCEFNRTFNVQNDYIVCTKIKQATKK